MSPGRAEALRTGLARALGVDPGPLALRPAGGGCINAAATTTAPGRALFVKWNDRPLPRQFEAEARGLEALRAAGALAAPAPVAWSDAPGAAFLALEHVAPGPRAPGFDEALGRGLAALHRTSAPEGFGFALDGYCGATPQPNGWRPGWVAFFAERRLGHLVALARAAGLERDGVAALERVVARLDRLLAGADGLEGPSSLIHGDLWSGNLHVTPEGRPCLVDPAAYFGHREAELGMMRLFGGFGPRVWAAYQEAWPLAPGWDERLGLYELYHVLNHFVLFGGGYGAQAVRLARRYAG